MGVKIKWEQKRSVPENPVTRGGKFVLCSYKVKKNVKNVLHGHKGGRNLKVIWTVQTVFQLCTSCYHFRFLLTCFLFKQTARGYQMENKGLHWKKCSFKTKGI